MLRVSDLKKTFEGADTPSVNGLSFELKPGEIYGLLGPNGAGKSTTVSMICGLINLSGGQIQNSFKRIGIAPQEIALFPTLTAFENIRYFGQLHGIEMRSLIVKAHHFLEQFQLEEKKDKQVFTFSGGMKRRLNLIVALLNDPDLLILDEPTAGVDVQSRNLIVEILKEQNANGVAIMYSSHLMEEAERLCDRIGIIDNGKLVLEGHKNQLLQQCETDSLESLFLKTTGKKIRD